MLRDLVVYTTFHLTRKQTPHSHKQHNRNENFGYMTSNESIGLRVSHTQYKRVKKIQQGAFMKEIFSVNSGARVAKKILFEKKKKAVHELGRVYRNRTPANKGKPPSFFNRSYICLPSFNYGFSKGA